MVFLVTRIEYYQRLSWLYRRIVRFNIVSNCGGLRPRQVHSHSKVVNDDFNLKAAYVSRLFNWSFFSKRTLCYIIFVFSLCIYDRILDNSLIINNISVSQLSVFYEKSKTAWVLGKKPNWRESIDQTIIITHNNDYKLW